MNTAKDKPSDNKVYVHIPGDPETEQEDRSSTRRSPIERYFLPARTASSLIYVMLLLLFCLIGWAAWANLDMIVEAKGQVIPAGLVKVVQPAVEGVIEKISVREGQEVKAGEILLTLDREHYLADCQKQESELVNYTRKVDQEKIAKIALEKAMKDPNILVTVPSEVGDVARVLSELYTASQNVNEARLDYQSSSHQVISGDRVTLQQRFDKLTTELAQKQTAAKTKLESYDLKSHEQQSLIKTLDRQLEEGKVETGKRESVIQKTYEQANAYEKAFKRGIVSNVEYLNIRKQVENEEISLVTHKSKLLDLLHSKENAQLQLKELASEAATQKSLLEAELSRMQADIETVRMQLRDCGRRYGQSETAFQAALGKARASLKQVEQNLDADGDKLAQLRDQIVIAKHALNQTDVRAPVDGVVTSLKLRGANQVVTRGEQLMSLVPTSDQLVEALVPNSDIGFVNKGQRVRIKIDAFPFQDYGIITGEVTNVESTAEEKDGNSTYRVRIKPSRTWIQVRDKKLNLISGMTVTAEIVTKQRTVLSMVLEPLRKLEGMGVRE
ncbi:MAG: HlyD family efflux transporter periplasmic adaptor subunit [Candidatus Obscuribacterales bacterium]|nr:HlyD family efflux transporter periplasmic adaptor subunit [Candidatus Obscuribacterales bacterium]